VVLKVPLICNYYHTTFKGGFSLWIRIDTNSKLTISRQLYNKLKDMILGGTLSPNEKLPSTRALARDLGISRNTVLEVYNQLICEGYLEGHHGSGTIVTACISKKLEKDNTINRNSLPDSHKKDVYLIDFRSGVPDLEYFPKKEWGKLYHNICNDLPATALRYSSPAGVFELRNAMS
jgi:GntR family transcriptional regulator/MocR family aminotransferase